MITSSSVLVFGQINPLAHSKELQLAVEQPMRRVYEECCLVSFAKNGLVPSRDELMTMHETVSNWPDSFCEENNPDALELIETLKDGLYTRELHMPKDTIIAGKIHKYPYFVSLLAGKCLIVSEFYNKIVEAPCSFTLPAGIKHIVFNIEDTVWSDVHNVKSSTVSEASKEIFAETYNELDDYMNIIEVKSCLDG